jgi:hypothetical protein
MMQPILITRAVILEPFVDPSQLFAVLPYITEEIYQGLFRTRKVQNRFTALIGLKFTPNGMTRMQLPLVKSWWRSLVLSEDIKAKTVCL